MASNAYSFQDVTATIAGPGGILNLGQGAAVADEGITIEPSTDKNVMTIGADGQGMHSLIADDSGKIIVRLLKVSPTNAELMAMYDVQSVSSALWGINIITVRNTATGDTTVAQSVAFTKKPTLTYAKEGGMNEWTFEAISINTILG